MTTRENTARISSPPASADWKRLRTKYETGRAFDIAAYHKILSPDVPDFLQDYLDTPAMQRLSGAGLLCGTDWTPLYQNRFYYSRLDHSIGAALIIWHFTRDKVQTLSGLFHDISTPAFSHVIDFKNGDHLTQTSTENRTEAVIRSSKEICALLERSGIPVEKICDYHVYPVADNALPRLSADRLEYMFPSGAALLGSWTLEEVVRVYGCIKILRNEDGLDELGFTDTDAAAFYTEKFLETGHVLQLNENKLTLQLLARILSCAEEAKIILPDDLYALSEAQIMRRFDSAAGLSSGDCTSGVFFEDAAECALALSADALPAERAAFAEFQTLYRTFVRMTDIIRSDEPLRGCFCVNLAVKQRWINPLVQENGMPSPRRIAGLYPKTVAFIKAFLDFKDSPYGCVRLTNS